MGALREGHPPIASLAPLFPPSAHFSPAGLPLAAQGCPPFLQGMLWAGDGGQDADGGLGAPALHEGGQRFPVPRRGMGPGQGFFSCPEKQGIEVLESGALSDIRGGGQEGHCIQMSFLFEFLQHL